MGSHPLQDFIRRLRHARSVTESGHLTDAQLLERFAKQRDEAAFEVLVWRHGTLVLNVARRLLHHAADAEDVFQATFLTLARKAAAIRRGTAIGSWLFKVAYRLALRARQTATRRESQQHVGLENLATPGEHDDAELNAVLAEEVNRLPERCRAVVVLCYLQGATTGEAARVLGCPRGTVLSRLASARQRLRQRLVRRGIAPAAALSVLSIGETASAGPSTALVASVVAASLPFAAGGGGMPMVSSQGAALAQGALQTMMWTKIKIVTLMACMIGVVGTGSGWLARSRSAVEASLPAAEPPGNTNESLPKTAPAPADKVKKEIDKIHAEIDNLADRIHDEETGFSRAVIAARLQLLESQDELKWRKEMFDFEREKKRNTLKGIQREIARLQEVINDFAQKDSGAQPPSLKSAIKQKKTLEEQMERSQALEEKYFIGLRETRRTINRDVIQAEENVRLLETRHARRREEFAAERERLQARLQRFEDKTLYLEPADRLRGVERKLDTLRREVGELRRALERPKPR